jgi:hypothetical protein
MMAKSALMYILSDSIVLFEKRKSFLPICLFIVVYHLELTPGSYDMMLHIRVAEYLVVMEGRQRYK